MKIESISCQVRTARKQHQCELCLCPIHKGDEYGYEVLKELDGADLIDLNKVWHQAKDVMPPSAYGGNHGGLVCVHQFKPNSHPYLTHEENCPEFEEYLKANPNDWWCRTGDLLKKEHRELYWR